MWKNLGNFLKKGMKPGIGLFILTIIGETVWNKFHGSDDHKPTHFASKIHPSQGIFPSDTTKFPPPNKIPTIIEPDNMQKETLIKEPLITPDSEIIDENKIDEKKIDDDETEEDKIDEKLFDEPLDVNFEVDDDDSTDSHESPPPFTDKFDNPSFENVETEIPCFPDKMKEKPKSDLKETAEVPPKESLTTPNVIDEIDRNLDSAVENLIDVKFYKAEKITVEGDTDEDMKSTSIDDSNSELRLRIESSIEDVDNETVFETSEDDEIRTESVIFISKPNEVKDESSISDADDVLENKPPRYRGYYDTEPEQND